MFGGFTWSGGEPLLQDRFALCGALRVSPAAFGSRLPQLSILTVNRSSFIRYDASSLHQNSSDDENKINHLCCSSRDCASDDRGSHMSAQTKRKTGLELRCSGKAKKLMLSRGRNSI